ncbi:MAG: hypothetical protein PHH77_04920 [Victivallaceae bacterium]|nr:hypothetical protein [Victivallaceae bacterium]
MNFFKSGLIVSSAIVLLCGCSTVKQPPKNEVKPNLSKIQPAETEAAKKFASSQAENYFKALKNNDYKAFCKSKKLNREDFKKWHRSIIQACGKLESQEYMGAVSNPLIIRYMWKWNFKKEIKGKVSDRQALYSVYVVKDKKENKYILFASGLQ